MSTESPGTCVELLQAMVGFDTVNPHVSGRPDAEAAMAEYLEAQARAMGLEARRLPVGGRAFNLLVTHETGTAVPWLLFDSHMDTVSVEGMTVEPFAGRVEGGRLYGRGACDTKGSGAAMLWALREYAATGGGPNNVGLLFTVSEEVGKDGMRAFVGGQLDALPWRPSGAVVGEPTGLRLVVAHNGTVRWNVRTRGVPAHSADPSRGRSAISMMARVIQAVEARYIASLDARHPLTGKAQCSINIIRGGSQINIIPDLCEVWLDRRLVPGEDPAGVLPAVERLLAELRQDAPGFSAEQGAAEINRPLDSRGNEALARRVQVALVAACLPADPVGAGYDTHAADLSAHGIPAVVLGPGDIEQAHTRDEWVAVDLLHRAAGVYLALMRAVGDS